MKILTILAIAFLALGIIAFIMAIRYYSNKNVKAVKKELSVVSTRSNDIASNVETYRRAGKVMPKDSTEDDIKASFLSENRPESYSTPVIQTEERAEKKVSDTDNYGTSALYESISKREAQQTPARPAADDTSLLRGKKESTKTDNADTSLLKDKDNDDDTHMLIQSSRQNEEDDDSTKHLSLDNNTEAIEEPNAERTSLLGGKKTSSGNDSDEDDTKLLRIEENAEF